MNKDHIKIKVMTVVGTRPEIVRLSEVIKELDLHTDHCLVHTGQNYDYELNEIFFKELKLRKPDYFLDAAKKTSVGTIANIIAKIDIVLEKEKPDAFLVLGDTNSCLAAYAAKRRKIPIFHMEAGNRCFDERVPEEINRKIIDHISDINITYSDLSRTNLLREGLSPNRVLKSGSPMYEVISAHKKEIDSSRVLKRLKLSPRGYFVLSAHREENVSDDGQFQRLLDIIRVVSDTYKLPIIFSAHPRTKKKLEEKNVILPKQVIISKPMGFFDFVKLQINAVCTLSDSGTISEESSILKFSAINLREAHERPEAMDETAVIMTGLNTKRVIQSIELLTAQRVLKNAVTTPSDYMVGNVSKKIVRIILSHVDYINVHVWKKRLN